VSDIDEDYEDGDVNRIESSAPRREADAPTAGAVLEYLAQSLAEDPAAVTVNPKNVGNRVILSLNVAQVDMGRVIGRRGRTAQALRILVAAAGARDGVSTSVDIVD
jgi:predicted RNA-binding protein YlqC (UPF0109 family)